MLVPVMAVAVVHLFTAVLAELTSDPYPICYRKWDSPAMSCFRKDLVSIKNTQTLIDGGLPMYGSQEKRRNITLPAGHCTQLSCIEGDAILYCHHPSDTDPEELDLPVTIDYGQVLEAVTSIVGKCAYTVVTGMIQTQTVDGEAWFNGGLSSAVLTRQKCRRHGETTDGPKGEDPPPSDSSDALLSSATTEAKDTPTKTTKPKSQKTASPEPPTTTHKAPETNTNSPTDGDWLLTTCFSESSPKRAVYSHKIVQDNIEWIGAHMKTIPRNSGEGNCTRLACHRNSAIFFCNDDGDLHSDLANATQIVDGAGKIVNACRIEGKNSHGYVDIIAGEITHSDKWRVVIQSSPCDKKEQGDQVTVQIAPDKNKSKTTQSGKDKKTKSESRSSIDKALDFLRPKTRNNDLTIRGAIRAARACKASAPPSKKVVRRDPPPGYVRHSCWGSLKNASFPSPIEAGIHYLNNLDGRPGINAGKCDQVSCSWDTAISWCSTNLERFELDSFKQIAAGAQFILDNCDVPADTCWVGHDISGQVWFKDKWSVVVSGSLQHC